jgi:hypothetical protein
MPTQKSNQLWQYFQKSEDIADFFNWFSNKVWEHQKNNATRPPRLSKVYETQFSAELVQEILDLIQANEIYVPLRIFHAEDETATGRDLEIILEIEKDEYLLFHCQAKRLFLKENEDPLKAAYEMLNHSTKDAFQMKTLQMKTLIQQTQAGAYPIYMLYNYTSSKKMLSKEYPKPEMFGCTIINAHYLSDTFLGKKSLSTLKFNDLHEPAKPLASLCRIKDKKDLKIWGDSPKIQNVRIFNRQFIDDNHLWDEINPYFSQGRFVQSIPASKLAYQNVDEPPFFNPKFRIVLTKQTIYPRRPNISYLL